VIAANQPARTLAKNFSTSDCRLPPSLDNSRAESSTSLEARPVSPAAYRLRDDVIEIDPYLLPPGMPVTIPSSPGRCERTHLESLLQILTGECAWQIPSFTSS
jgi:hypothetical protein